MSGWEIAGFAAGAVSVLVYVPTAATQIGFIALCVAGVRQRRASLNATIHSEPLAVAS